MKLEWILRRAWSWSNWCVIGCFFSFLFSAEKCLAQQKVTRPANFWPELQVEYVLKNTSFFYFRNHYRFNFNDEVRYLGEDGLTRNLERVQVRAGYEQVFNNQWSLGIAESYAVERTRKVLFNEFYIRHVNTIGKIRFAQRGSLEHVVRWPASNNGRVRLRADLDRNFTVGKNDIRPRVSYEFFYNLNYEPQKQQNNNQRLVDRTRLRLEVMYALNQKFSITPYFTKQVDFTGVSPVANPAGEIIKPAAKQNSYTPIWGLDVRYVLFQGGKPFSRTIPTDSSK